MNEAVMVGVAGRKAGKWENCSVDFPIGEADFPSAKVPSMPNWALTTSDFFGWVEALREHAGYEKIEDLSRTFWAHFPSASCLGYELSDPDEE
uniref:Si:ch73-23l24.1 n=1 Tax=Oncorhynchus mykiss TaxID=8022 RepID=A0A8C7S1L1_ONCMY